MTLHREPGQVTASNTALYAQSIINMAEPLKNESVTSSAVYCGLLELRGRLLILESVANPNPSKVIAIK